MTKHEKDLVKKLVNEFPISSYGEWIDMIPYFEQWIDGLPILKKEEPQEQSKPFSIENIMDLLDVFSMDLSFSYTELTDKLNKISHEFHKQELLKAILDKIERYEKLGFTSDYIHVALKEYLKGALSNLK